MWEQTKDLVVIPQQYPLLTLPLRQDRTARGPPEKPLCDGLRLSLSASKRSPSFCCPRHLPLGLPVEGEDTSVAVFPGTTHCLCVTIKYSPGQERGRCYALKCPVPANLPLGTGSPTHRAFQKTSRLAAAPSTKSCGSLPHPGAPLSVRLGVPAGSSQCLTSGPLQCPAPSGGLFAAPPSAGTEAAAQASDRPGPQRGHSSQPWPTFSLYLEPF